MKNHRDALSSTELVAPNTNSDSTSSNPSQSESDVGSKSKKIVWLASRKWFRLWEQSDHPVWVLDSKNRIRFASLSLAKLVGVDSKELIGQDCNKPSSGSRTNDERSDGNTNRELPDFLVSSGVNHSIDAQAQLISLLPTAYRLSSATNETGSHQNASNSDPHVVLSIRIGSRTESFFRVCILLKPNDPFLDGFKPPVEWIEDQSIRDALLAFRRQFLKLEDLVFLQGKSPLAQRTMLQLNAAINSYGNVCIIGPSGCLKSTIAKTVFNQRRRRAKAMLAGGRLIPIDCRLMDQMLMTEMLEVVADQIQLSYETRERVDDRKSKVATSENAPSEQNDLRSTASIDQPQLLLRRIDLLPTDALKPLIDFLKRFPNIAILSTANSIDNIELDSLSPHWQEVLARLTTSTIVVAPLRDRIADINTITNMMLDQIHLRSKPSSTNNKRRQLSSPARSALQTYSWPGNYVELQQTIQQAYENATEEIIDPVHLGLAINTYPSHVFRDEHLPVIDLDKQLESFERSLLQQALDAFPNNRAAAARHLNISRSRFLRRIALLGLVESEIQADRRTVTTDPSKPPIDDSVETFSLTIDEEMPVEIDDSSQDSLQSTESDHSDMPVFKEIE